MSLPHALEEFSVLNGFYMRLLVLYVYHKDGIFQRTEMPSANGTAYQFSYMQLYIRICLVIGVHPNPNAYIK